MGTVFTTLKTFTDTTTAVSGVGVVIDVFLSRESKLWLMSRFNAFQKRFDEVQWSNFGQKEAALVIEWLDRCLGERFFSKRRIAVVFSLTVAAFVFGMSRGPIPDKPVDWVHFFQFAATLISFNLALSLNRAIAVGTMRITRLPVIALAFFVLSIFLQVVLFAIWTSLLSDLIFFTLADVFLGGAPVVANVLTTATTYFNMLLDGDLPRLVELRIDKLNSGFIEAARCAIDCFVYGTRILVAIIFLLFFLFRPVLKPAVSRLFAVAIESGKPPFTLLFIAIGVVVATARALMGAT